MLTLEHLLNNNYAAEIWYDSGYLRDILSLYLGEIDFNISAFTLRYNLSLRGQQYRNNSTICLAIMMLCYSAGYVRYDERGDGISML